MFCQSLKLPRKNKLNYKAKITYLIVLLNSYLINEKYKNKKVLFEYQTIGEKLTKKSKTYF